MKTERNTGFSERYYVTNGSYYGFTESTSYITFLQNIIIFPWVIGNTAVYLLQTKLEMNLFIFIVFPVRWYVTTVRRSVHLYYLPFSNIFFNLLSLFLSSCSILILPSPVYLCTVNLDKWPLLQWFSIILNKESFIIFRSFIWQRKIVPV